MLVVATEPVEHFFQRAAGLAGLHEVDVKLRERFRELRQRLGQTGALFDVSPDLAEDFRERLLLCPPLQRHHRLAQRHAGAQQAGKLLREHQDVAGGDAVAEAERDLAFAFLDLRGFDRQREVSEATQFSQREAAITCSEGARDQFARACLGFVLERGH